MTDAELLQRFTATADATAFGELVSRYLALVYAAARRQVRDAHLADDVTQAVFVVLAHKARSIDPRYLAGWLMTTARLAAKSALRSAARRAQHERRAAMSADAPTHDRSSSEPTSEQIEAIRAVLDRGLSRLNDADRTAVVLRYLRGCSVAEVGSAMGISEEAARKRVERSLAKLRERLGNDALTVLGSSALGPLIGTSAKVHVPAHLTVVTITHAAIHQATTTAAWAVAAGALKAMFITKLKIAACFAAAALLVTGLGYEGARFALAARQHDKPKVEQPADAGGLVAVLKSGVRVELIGMGGSPPRGKPWWRADGSPLEQPPYARMPGSTSTDDPDRVVREVAVRQELTTAGGDKADARFAFRGSSASGQAQAATGQPIEGVEACATEFVRGAPATVRVEIAQGPWEETTIGVGSGSRSVAGNRGSIIYTDAYPSGNDTIRALTFVGELARDQVRVTAILTDGTELPARGRNSGGASNARQQAFSVPDTAPDSVASFRIQTRPYDAWVEFRDVATEPGMAAKPQIVTSETNDRH